MWGRLMLGGRNAKEMPGCRREDLNWGRLPLTDFSWPVPTFMVVQSRLVRLIPFLCQRPQVNISSKRAQLWAASPPESADEGRSVPTSATSTTSALNCILAYTPAYLTAPLGCSTDIT